MATHPAARWHFDDLSRELQRRIEQRLVRVAVAPDNPNLAIYCYTQQTVSDGAWDEVTMISRGIVLDHLTGVVRAYPFPKFFNHGERSWTLPDEPFRTYEKVDGSLGIVFHDGCRWRVATKGAFASPQARWAEAWLSKRDTSRLTIGHTYLAEIVYAENRIVVRYSWEGLVFLGAYDDRGVEYDRGVVERAAASIGARVVESHDYPSVEAMREAVKSFAFDREGFVIHFPASGHRVKLKGAEYLRVHRLISRVTPLALWEAMAAGDDLATIRRDVPEEFHADFDAIQAALAWRFMDLRTTIELEYDRHAHKSDKELGLSLASVAQEARPFVFVRRKKGADGMQSDPKTRRALFNTFRPTGNVLAGYVPSEALRRVGDDI